MSEKMICQHCWIPVVHYSYGWKHHPGPGGRVPNPGHKITPIPATYLDTVIKSVRESRKGQSP